MWAIFGCAEAARLPVIRRRVIENAVTVIAGNDFFATSHLGHGLRPQSHEAGHAGAVTRFSHGHAIANARH